MTKDDAFTYQGAGNITKVSPNAAQGGTLVTIDGTSLLGGGTKATAVSLAGITAQIQGDGKSNEEAQKICQTWAK